MPTTAEVPAWEKQDPRYVTLQRQVAAIGALMRAVLYLAIVVAAIKMPVLPDAFDVPLVIAWAIGTIVPAWWGQYRPGLAYRHESFRLDDDGIEIRQGIFWRSVIDVPRSRVQHTDVSQGPFERRHGLGTLAIYTAGVSYAEVSLPGLNHARALAIRDLLLPRARVSDS